MLQHLFEMVRGVSHGIGMSFGTHFLDTESCFIERAGGGPGKVFPHYRESTPHGKAFKSQNDFDTGFLLHPIDKRKVLAKQGLIQYVTRRGDM